MVEQVQFRNCRCVCGYFFSEYALKKSAIPVRCPKCRRVNPLNFSEEEIQKRLQELDKLYVKHKHKFVRQHMRVPRKL